MDGSVRVLTESLYEEIRKRLLSDRDFCRELGRQIAYPRPLNREESSDPNHPHFRIPEGLNLNQFYQQVWKLPTEIAMILVRNQISPIQAYQMSLPELRDLRNCGEKRAALIKEKSQPPTKA